MSDLSGRAVAGYPIQKLLHKGGYTVLYQAASSAAPLAVKLLRDDLRKDTALSGKIIQGWEAARAVTHPNLVAIMKTGTDTEFGAYSLEELVPGKPLRQMILGGPKMAWRDCLILCEQMFAAIKALHAAGQCHGEIWPGSILITQDQDLKLEGAGGMNLADRLPVEIMAGPAIGYVAPELIRGSPPSAGSDIYSAGACVYFILVGQDPHPGEDTQAIAATVLDRTPAPISALRDDLPVEVVEFIQRLMAKDPTQRYGEIAEVLADLERLKNGQELAPFKGGKPAAPPRAVPKPKGGSSSFGPRSPSRDGAKAGLAAAAIKAAGSGSKVFGRLETHVKSTIPQSETEKRGDDYYRQGQLPLAVNCWKEAYDEEAPHAGLKIKIELADRELKREAFTIAMEEARHRYTVGDYNGATERAREAIISADSEAQRQEAMRLETAAMSEARDAGKSKTLKTALIGVGALAAIVIAVIVFRGSSTDEGAGSADGAGRDGDTIKKKPPPSGPRAHVFPEAKASVQLPARWSKYNEFMLQVIVPGTVAEIAVAMEVQPLPENVTVEGRYSDLLANSKLSKSTPREDPNQYYRRVDDSFDMAFISFNYERDRQPCVRYIYLVVNGNAEESTPVKGFSVVFDGKESTFDKELQEEMDEIMRSWTFRIGE